MFSSIFISLKAEVPELEKLVPGAKAYELIYQFNPLKYSSVGYQVDNAESYVGTLKRIGYLLKLTDKAGKTTWVFTSMDPFTQDLLKVGVPCSAAGVFQTYVNNLEVAGNASGLKTGKFEKGNIEFWSNNYGPNNAVKIPEASSKEFDFGDVVDTKHVNGHGSMQIHNYLQKQTVFSFNCPRAGRNCGIGIGNNETGKGHPDWTFSKSGALLKNAEMYVVGQFKDLKIQKVAKLDQSKVSMRGTTTKAFFAPGEEMVFTLDVDYGDQTAPTQPCVLKWYRTGDDKKTASGKGTVVSGTPITIKTSSDKPGFVRIRAWLLDSKGRNIKTLYRKRKINLTFDGGAGVQPEKLQPATEEPADFDEFWKKQKAKLAAVPVKADMVKVSKPGAPVEVYGVSVACAGPHPVTGYLTIPAGAKDKSLPASCSYQCYGTGIQRAPGWGPKNRIHFNINAHGYDLGKDSAYYKDFFASIKSNKQRYAFDPQQNSDAESAYFNGMALRVMRSLQFLKSLPQWNGKELTVSGGSQGGLQTVWAAGLDADVTAAYPSVPWCCDFAGTTIGRLNGWRPKYVPALNYYDCVFHAKRIKCPVTITRAGLGDYTCPPSGIAVLYNNIKTPKECKWYQGSTHCFVPKNPQIFIEKQK
ncbi:MAG: acetylxylan esterase [Victivallales bacterium]|nr:acetylxylan esterase [Victivallales bacterium]